MYLALYRKYRPKTFSEVISQPHITTALKNQIKAGQIAHAYLFTGSRGTGKTTCAKVLAKAVNCLSPVDGDPCLKCEACLNADISPDISEIDAASNNGVDDIRNLRNEAAYLPSELTRKVYIIDEVHMLTGQAFNALLKTLEEPPPHVIFILATTESHKIPATVLSRCQRFEFNRINAEECAEALIKVAEKEGFVLEAPAARLIARLSDGGMRDALSLLDVVACENNTITAETILDCAGVAGKEHLFSLAHSIASGDVKGALSILSELYSKSKEPARLIDELITHFRNLMIVKIAGNSSFDTLLTTSQEEIPDYLKQAESFTLEEIIKHIDTLEAYLRLKGRKTETEICLMRLCLSKSAVNAPAVNAPQPVRSAPPVNVAPVQPVRNVQPLLNGTPHRASPTPVYQEPPPVPPPVFEREKLSTVNCQLSTEPPPPVFEREERGLPHRATPTVEQLSTVNCQLSTVQDWNKILDALDAYKASMLEEAKAELNGDAIIVTGSEVLGYFFDNEENLSALTEAVKTVTGKDYRVIFNPSTPLNQEETPINGASKIKTFLNDAENLGVKVKII